MNSDSYKIECIRLDSVFKIFDSLFFTVIRSSRYRVLFEFHNVLIARICMYVHNPYLRNRVVKLYRFLVACRYLNDRILKYAHSNFENRLR